MKSLLITTATFAWGFFFFSHPAVNPSVGDILAVLAICFILGAVTGSLVAFTIPRLSSSKIGRGTLTASGSVLTIALLMFVRSYILSDYETLGIHRDEWHTIMLLLVLFAMPFFWHFANKRVIPWIEGQK